MMIKKSIIAIVVIVAAAALVFGASGNHTNSTDPEPNISTSNSDTSDNSSTSDNNDSQTKKISAEEAKKIAQNYIEEPGATAGTPKLSEEDGNYVYTVPVLVNGTNVGEISIDAQTGKNVGGAGGAP